MYLIVHETAIKSLFNILKVNRLLKSSKVQKIGAYTGQGSPKKRRLASDPRVSLVDSKFSSKYDEVDGVYFRLLNVSTPIETRYGGDCVMVFSKEVLDNDKFVINTEENFGFCIGPDGVVSESQFSGENGMSITDLKNLKLLKEYNFDPYQTEILIMDDVSLNLLQSIFVKHQLINDSLIEVCNQKHIQLYAL